MLLFYFCDDDKNCKRNKEERNYIYLMKYVGNLFNFVYICFLLKSGDYKVIKQFKTQFVRIVS